MTFRLLTLRQSAAALAALLAAGIATPVFADAPPASLIARSSPAGNYLAARLASAERDNAAAAAYYRALVRVFPRSGEILERAFLTLLAEGSIDEAVPLAKRIVEIDPEHRLSRLVLGAQAIKAKHYVTARSNLRRAGQGAISEMSATLMLAWAQFGAGDARGAVATIDGLQGPDWYAAFKDFHAGLILDAAGNRKEAGKRLDEALKIDPRTLRVVDAYARWAARSGNRKLAVETYEQFDKVLPNDPLVERSIEQIEAGKPLPPLAANPAQGSAEALYGLGAALGRQGGEDLALVYLQLAHWLDPAHPLVEITLADLFENMKKYDEAIALFRAVPDGSPLKESAQIQLGLALERADRFEESRAALEAVVAKNPKDIQAISALGEVLRANEKYAEAAEVYTKAIDLLQAPTPANWDLFFSRGTAYERTKQWAKSEADLKKALELRPDTPAVLNYLGYSWVDQGVNLDEGLDMIRKAVTLRPDDGYYIDSLGWAYYRLKRYDEAVRELERAVELKPDEAVINDHLGDAYWRVGRKLEARFKWNHARDLKPDADELAKIERKIAVGLDDAEKAKVEQPAMAPTAQKQDNGG